MTIDDRIRRIVLALPEDSAFTIPVRTLREWLESATDASPPLTQQGVQADLTVECVAELMRRGESTVRGWLARGDFPGAYKLYGKEWRIPPIALQHFQMAQQQAPPVRAPATRRRKGPTTLAEWRI